MSLGIALMAETPGVVRAQTIPEIEWGTYFGGVEPEFVQPEEIHGVSAREDGVLISGVTAAMDGIASKGAYQKKLRGDLDAFIARFNMQGGLLWGTYYGGNGNDFASDVAVDPVLDVAYLVGLTSSSNGMAMHKAHQQLYAGGEDGFIAKFDLAGKRLWGTYYGGADFDSISSAGVDIWGDLYVCGQTRSPTQIATVGSHLPTLMGDQRSFLAKFDATGERLWGTYYGGGACTSLAVNEEGDAVYIAGFVFESDDEIATEGAHQEFSGGGFDGYLARFDADGTRVWGTYYGGESFDDAASVEVDCTGAVYLGGDAVSSEGISTPDAHQELRAGDFANLYLAKFTPEGERLWGTYYGGSGSHNGGFVAAGGVCDDGDDLAVYLAGATTSEGLATPGAPRISIAGESDALLVKFNPDGEREWATYYGGENDELTMDLDADTTNVVHLGGSTLSTQGIATPGGHQTELRGGGDGFLAQFSDLATNN